MADAKPKFWGQDVWNILEGLGHTLENKSHQTVASGVVCESSYNSDQLVNREHMTSRKFWIVLWVFVLFCVCISAYSMGSGVSAYSMGSGVSAFVWGVG